MEMLGENVNRDGRVEGPSGWLRDEKPASAATLLHDTYWILPSSVASASNSTSATFYQRPNLALPGIAIQLPYIVGNSIRLGFKGPTNLHVRLLQQVDPGV